MKDNANDKDCEIKSTQSKKKKIPDNLKCKKIVTAKTFTFVLSFFIH